MPRQSPQIPPKLEMKSNQVILGDLSNSGNQNGYNLCITEYRISFLSELLTKHCWFSKKDVHNSNVLLISIVEVVPLKNL